MPKPMITNTQLDKLNLALGARIKALRTANKLTQLDLGTACGITAQQIQKYETGKNRVPFSRLWQISNALGVTIGTITHGITL